MYIHSYNYIQSIKMEYLQLRNSVEINYAQIICTKKMIIIIINNDFYLIYSLYIKKTGIISKLKNNVYKCFLIFFKNRAHIKYFSSAFYIAKDFHFTIRSRKKLLVHFKISRQVTTKIISLSTAFVVKICKCKITSLCLNKCV